jgi:hypothetical protein
VISPSVELFNSVVGVALSKTGHSLARYQHIILHGTLFRSISVRGTKRPTAGRHLYVTGSTGSGKSKFLEHLIRQDIMNWRKGGECGLLLLDPHGAIYDGLMHWLTRTRPYPHAPCDPDRFAARRLGGGV